MELRQAIEKRASVRRYKNVAVPLEDLFEMVRLAGLSPSINNAQPWKFVVITNKLLLSEMADSVHEGLDQLLGKLNSQDDAIKTTLRYYSTFFKEAPSVIAVAMSSYEATIDKVLKASGLDHNQLNEFRQYPDIQSIGACVQTLLLAAVDMGYGACWLSGL
ncbi:nitroreductase family protein, partial [candidate division KSB1 bacterium]|nr:nitroreductase family protein [candidate division KSB1 bacterium]